MKTTSWSQFLSMEMWIFESGTGRFPKAGQPLWQRSGVTGKLLFTSTLTGTLYEFRRVCLCGLNHGGILGNGQAQGHSRNGAASLGCRDNFGQWVITSPRVMISEYVGLLRLAVTICNPATTGIIVVQFAMSTFKVRTSHDFGSR